MVKANILLFYRRQIFFFIISSVQQTYSVKLLLLVYHFADVEQKQGEVLYFPSHLGFR